MTQIPIKTRQRILRKARMRIAQGKNTLICRAIKDSDRRFELIETSKVSSFFPEIKKRKPKGEEPLKGCWFKLEDSVSRINLLSDAINQLNQKIKEAESAAGHRLDEHKRQPARREKTNFSANQW